MRRLVLRSVALALCLSGASVPALAAEPAPCSPGFDYSMSREAASPGASFEMYGSWGPAQLDRAPDLITGGAMSGGAGRLEVLEWSPTRVRVRVHRLVSPGQYSLGVFCGPRLSGVSPFKLFTVLQPNPHFQYHLSTDTVRAGEVLELVGDWKLPFDRRPTLVYRNRQRLQLEVTSWTENELEVRIPILLEGRELVGASPLSAEIFVDSDEPHLMAGYRSLEILPPDREALQRARVDEGLAAPWITGSPERLAIAAFISFLLGVGVLGLRGMAVAASDLALAAVFVITWIWPFTFDFIDFSSLGILVVLEFVVIHSSAFLVAAGLVKTTTLKKAGVIVALSGLYSLFVWGLSSAASDHWPLVMFWTLTGAKLVPLFVLRSPVDQGLVLGRAALGTVIYVLTTLVAVILPLPALGWVDQVPASGAFMEDAPHRLLFMGAVYFTLVGVGEAYITRWVRETPAHIAD